jgi:hypothetical protein
MNRRNAHRAVRSSLLPVGLCGATVNPRFGPDDRGKDTSMRATGYQDD